MGMRLFKNEKKATLEMVKDQSHLLEYWAEFDLLIKQTLWLSGEHHQFFSLMMAKMQEVLSFGEDNVASIEEINAAISELEEMSRQSTTFVNDLNEARITWQKAFDTTKAIFANIQTLNAIVIKSNNDAIIGNQNLQTSADEIDGITSYIRKIAKETHLLALNASIEAARAGEAGRGFAVVAEEINKLSSETESATAKIETIVSTFKNRTASLDKSMSDMSNHSNTVTHEINSSQSVFDAIETAFSAMTQAITELNDQTLHQRETTKNLHAAISTVASAITDTHALTLDSLSQTKDLQEKNEELIAVYDRLEGVVIKMKNHLKPEDYADKIIVGVNPFTSPLRILELYGPILKSCFKENYVLYVPKDYEGIQSGLSSGFIDVAWLSPFAYVQTSKVCSIEPLASPEVGGKANYKGLIVSNSLHQLNQLNGKFGFVDKNSASGYIYARAHLQKNALSYDPVFYGSHDRVIEAVLKGEVMAGATYNEALDYYKGNTASLKILFETQAIPKDCIAFNKKSKKGDLSHLKALFTSYHDQNEANITGFIAIDDRAYDVVREVE